MKIDINEIVNCLYDANNNDFYYYIPDNIILIFDHENAINENYEDINLYDNEEDLIALPDNYEIDNYKIMHDFIYEKTDGEIKEWLIEAIKGKGAFRNFRACLERFNIENEWYKYRDDAYKEIAILWCEKNLIEYDYNYDSSNEIDEVEEIINEDYEKIKIVRLHYKNYQSLLPLHFMFIKELSNFSNNVNENDSLEKLNYYKNNKFPIFMAVHKGEYIGFATIKIIDNTLWLEEIYVKEIRRNQGIGKLLLNECELFAKNEYKQEYLYINVLPNNKIMLNFLKNNNYDVVNLIEFRKNNNDEQNNNKIIVNDNDFKY